MTKLRTVTATHRHNRRIAMSNSPPQRDSHIPDPRDPTNTEWDFQPGPPNECTYYSDDGTVLYDPDRPLAWLESTAAILRRKAQ